MPNTSANNILSNGNFYKLHPEKVLGKEITLNSKGNHFTDVFSREISKFEGSFDLLNKIELPELYAKIEQPKSENNKTKQNTEQLTFDNEILKNSEKEITTTIKRKRKKKKTNISISANTDAELTTAKETFKLYNKNISKDELYSFLYYQYAQGTMWKGIFKEMFNPETLTGEQEQQYIEDWVNKGVLFYHKGEYLPKVFYLSGNIMFRKNALAEDKERIIKLYSQKVYETQENLVKEISDKVYNKRLLLDADIDKRLKFAPTHSLARRFKITSLDDEKQFKGIAYSGNNTNIKKGIVGRINFDRDYSTYANNAKIFDELNLQDAFIYWLKENKITINFKLGTDWKEIWEFYIKGKRYNENRDGNRENFNNKKSRARKEGIRLFSEFLAKNIKAGDRVKIETEFNIKLNSYVAPDYRKIPVAITTAKYYPDNRICDIRPEKRSNIAFMSSQGSGLIPDPVGFGKTWSGIMIAEQMIEIGQAKRPLLIVPNQTYKQWLSEIRGILPHREINDLYNLSENYVSQLYDIDGNIKELPANSISLMTYEGMNRLGFKGVDRLHALVQGYTYEVKEDEPQNITDTTAYKLYSELKDILRQEETSSDKKRKKNKSSLANKILELLGTGNRDTTIDIEDLNFDFVGFDEAHALKKIFTRVVSKDDESKYAIQSGQPSTRAIKGFMLSHYIKMQNNFRNILLLTATPVTNSPLEVFSMLSLIAYREMADGFTFDSGNKRKLNGIVDFFDNFAETTNDFVFTASMNFERRDIFVGWQNLPSLQRLLYRYSNYKDPDSVKITRPEKIEIPYMSDELSDDEKINAILPLTPIQEFMVKNIVLYAEGKISYSDFVNIDFDPNSNNNDTGIIDAEIEEDQAHGEMVVEDDLNDDEKAGVKMLRSVSMNRAVAISPYFLRISNGKTLRYALPKPTYKEFIETSTKLKFTMDCVKMFKEHYENKNEPVSGQVIYLDRGKEYFPLIKEYLVKEVGFKEQEIGMIYSGMKTPKGISSKDAKTYIQNKFLGIEYDANLGIYKNIPHEDRIKVLIGSSSIREGMNLQKHSVALYDLFPAWNPTDRIQLIGRIHRQKNKHKYVFIITPLMINSIDIFLMQKLQEKTARINALWDKDGETSVLDTTDFDPEELKFQLLESPKVIAQLKIDEIVAKLKDNISGLTADIGVAKQLKDDYSTIEYYKDDLKAIVDRYRPARKNKKTGKVQSRELTTLLILLGEIIKTQKDENGKLFESYGTFDWDRWKLERDNYPFLSRSYDSTLLFLDTPHWYEDFKSALYFTGRKSKDRKAFADPESLNRYIEDVQKNIDKIYEEIEYVQSEDAVKELLIEITEKKEQSKVTSRSPKKIIRAIKERFEDKFSEVIEDKKAKAPTIDEIIAKMPRMNGKLFANDPKTIAEIDYVNSKLPQTEEMFTDENGEYTHERKLFHEEIKADLRNKAQCIVEEHEQPIAVLTGGMPGSGKSYFLKKFAPYMNTEKILKIDADDIRSKFPEYKGWNANQTHREASRLVSEILEEVGTPCTTDILYDGTMNKTKNYIPLIRQLKRLGYKTFIVFVDVSGEVSKKRVLQRYAEVGRYVPEFVIDNAIKVGHEVYDEIKQLVNGYILVDGITRKIKEKHGEEIPSDRFWFNSEDTISSQALISLFKPIEDYLIEKSVITKKEKGGNFEFVKTRKQTPHNDILKYVETLINKGISQSEMVTKTQNEFDLPKQSADYFVRRQLVAHLRKFGKGGNLNIQIINNDFKFKVGDNVEYYGLNGDIKIGKIEELIKGRDYRQNFYWIEDENLLTSEIHIIGISKKTIKKSIKDIELFAMLESLFLRLEIDEWWNSKREI